MKAINNSLPKLVNSSTSKVKYDKDSLLRSLTQDVQKREIPKQIWKRPFIIPYQNLIRFVMLLTTAIVVVTLVLTFSFVFIKDVLLFKSDLSVNRQGVFMPSKACGREYCLFLFNTSDLWANTGIALNKGDKFKMSVSGAFHSSIGHLYRDTDLNNPSPDVKWIGGEQRINLSFIQDSLVRYTKHSSFYNKFFCVKKPQFEIPQKEKTIHCIATDSYIGAILYRIAPEFKLWNPNEKVYVWKPSLGNDYHVVDTSGILTMAINDIYFKSAEHLEKYIDSFPFRFDSIKLNCNGILRADGGKKGFKRMFYDDNLGQILVCLEIQHPLPGGFLNPLSAFRNLETQTELKSERINNKWLFKLSIIPSFILFIFHIFAIFIVHIVAALLIVYLLFLLGYWFIKGIKELVCLQKKETAANNTCNS